MPATGSRDTDENRGKVSNRLTAVTGIVVPVDWDDKGIPLATAILGTGEDEYYVEQDEQANKLLEVLTKEVEVKGEIGRASQGQKTIKVRSYSLKAGDEQWMTG